MQARNFSTQGTESQDLNSQGHARPCSEFKVSWVQEALSQKKTRNFAVWLLLWNYIWVSGFMGFCWANPTCSLKKTIDKKKSKISRLSTSNGNSRPSRWCMSARQEFLKVKRGFYKAQWFSTRGLEAGVGRLQQAFDRLALQKTFMFMTITVAKAQWWNTVKNMYLESPQHEELW